MGNTTMAIYRCTRPNVYGKGSPGHTDPTARQGYYIMAATTENAGWQMKEKFPHDTRFDCELWREPLPLDSDDTTKREPEPN